MAVSEIKDVIRPRYSTIRNSRLDIDSSGRNFDFPEAYYHNDDSKKPLQFSISD